MICPKCNSNKQSKVINSRESKKFGLKVIRRRRLCILCKYRYTTFEFIEGEMEKLLCLDKIEKLEKQITKAINSGKLKILLRR